MIKRFELFTEKKDNNIGKKIDFYYLKTDISTTRLRELFKIIEMNQFRAVATFSNNIEFLSELPVKKIGLINYPSEFISESSLFSQILNCVSDEIEFPWKKKYLQFKWRDIILKCLSNGKIIRPMVEWGIDSKEDVMEYVNFFKEIGILEIVTSTGLEDKFPTLEKIKEYNSLIPSIFKVKIISGIRTIELAKDYLKFADTIGTAKTNINLK